MATIVCFRRLALFLALAAPLLATAARADPVADFYKGKTLTVIIGAPPGGAYDLYARTIGKYVTRHIPGNPGAIFQNVLGSGSVQAINRIYNEAPRDGTVLGALSNAAPFLPLLGLEQARFDPQKLLWLGSPTAETSAFFVWYSVPVNSFDDLKTHDVIVGSNGPNASPAFFAKAMNAVFNTKIKTIYGYTGVPDTMLALQRGEIQGYTGIFWNQLKSGYGNLLDGGKLKILAQFGAAANPELPNVPLASDLIQAKDDKQLFSAVIAPLAIGYPLLMGPNIPADRAKAMLEAVAATFKDKDFLQETRSLNLAVAPLSGAEVAKVVADSYAIAPALIDRLRVLYNAE